MLEDEQDSDLTAENQELKTMNAALIRRLSEMESAYQTVRQRVAASVLPTEGQCDRQLEQDIQSCNKDEVRPRALYGSLLIPETLVAELAGQNRQSQWMFKPASGKLTNGWRLRIRSAPDRSSSKTEHSLKPCEIFSVAQEIQGADGTLYLELMDGRGWAFDSVEEVGILCVKLANLSVAYDDKKREEKSEEKRVERQYKWRGERGPNRRTTTIPSDKADSSLRAPL